MTRVRWQVRWDDKVSEYLTCMEGCDIGGYFYLLDIIWYKRLYVICKGSDDNVEGGMLHEKGQLALATTLILNITN